MLPESKTDFEDQQDAARSTSEASAVGSVEQRKPIAALSADLITRSKLRAQRQSTSAPRGRRVAPPPVAPPATPLEPAPATAVATTPAPLLDIPDRAEQAPTPIHEEPAPVAAAFAPIPWDRTAGGPAGGAVTVDAIDQAETEPPGWESTVSQIAMFISIFAVALGLGVSLLRFIEF